MQSRPRTHRRDGSLILGIFEDKPYYRINVSYRYIYFVAKMEHVVKSVVNYYFGRRDFLGSVPEAGCFGTGGAAHLVFRLFTSNSYLRLDLFQSRR
jgi:hypothetical protein